MWKQQCAYPAAQPDCCEEVALTTNCTAVGTYILSPSNGSNQEITDALVEHWDGTHWSIITTPIPDPSNPLPDYGSLTGVSCPTPTSCMAVGIYYTYCALLPTFSFAEQWNGSTWSIVPTAKPTNTQLNSVSCSSATYCLAVGSTSGNKPAVERWNGSQWSNVATPTPTATSYGPLNGVSCLSATNCTAVGA